MYRLTYAFTPETINTEIVQDATISDVVHAYDHAFNLLEERYGAEKLLEIIAMSVLMINYKVDEVGGEEEDGGILV